MDITVWQTSIWQQYGAAIDTLDAVLRACPNHLWRSRLWVEHNPDERPEYAEFWFLGYHTLKWIDLYLNGTVEGFAPPARFGRYEKEADGFPKTAYTREDLQAYLAECRRKCRAILAALTDETALRPCHFDWIGYELPFVELLLYTLRHVQEHAAQMNLWLGQNHVAVDDSVTRAGAGLA